MKDKREVFGEAMLVPADLFEQPFRLHAVEAREIRVQHHALATNDVDHAFRILDWQAFWH